MMPRPTAPSALWLNIAYGLLMITCYSNEALVSLLNVHIYLCMKFLKNDLEYLNI